MPLKRQESAKAFMRRPGNYTSGTLCGPNKNMPQAMYVCLGYKFKPCQGNKTAQRGHCLLNVIVGGIGHRSNTFRLCVERNVAAGRCDIVYGADVVDDIGNVFIDVIISAKA